MIEGQPTGQPDRMVIPTGKRLPVAGEQRSPIPGPGLASPGQHLRENTTHFSGTPDRPASMARPGLKGVARLVVHALNRIQATWQRSGNPPK